LKVFKRLTENLEYIKTRMGVGVTFDCVIRELKIGGYEAALVFIDGLIKDKVTLDVINALQKAERSHIVLNTVDKLIKQVIPYIELAANDELEDIVYQVLAGQIGLFIDSCPMAILLDLREYPVRSIEEPDLEKVTRGSKEGLVETMIFNTALIRRRLRDPNLRFEMMTVGKRTQTDVAIGYLDDVVDHKILKEIKKRLNKIGDDALPLGARSLTEYLADNPLSPIPSVRYSERPDVVAAHLLEGHVVVLADTTPMAMILPVTLWHFTQHAEEFFQNALIGTYLRWVRLLGTLVSLVLTPLWLALFLSKDMLSQWLQFIGPKGAYVVPVPLQFFILEIGIDLIRMALIHTPSAFSTSLGIVGAILLGDLAVSVGLFIPETILYTAVVAIGFFAIPSLEFGLAIRIGRYLLLLLASLWRLPGLIIGLVAVFLYLASIKSLGVPYLWPLIPLNLKALGAMLFRYPIPSVRERNPQVISSGQSKSNK
jgi:stage V sporulation protein AF